MFYWFFCLFRYIILLSNVLRGRALCINDEFKLCFQFCFCCFTLLITSLSRQVFIVEIQLMHLVGLGRIFLFMLDLCALVPRILLQIILDSNIGHYDIWWRDMNYYNRVLCYFLLLYNSSQMGYRPARNMLHSQPHIIIFIKKPTRCYRYLKYTIYAVMCG